jgi:cold shock CspA family protein
MNRIKGTITHWNRRKAYGFITPEDESKEVFVHISEFRDRREMPTLDELVEFTPSTDKQGRACATDVNRDVDSELSRARSIKLHHWVIGIVAALVLLGIIAVMFLR